MADDELDLGRHIESQVRILGVQSTNNPKRVGWSIEKVRVAKSDVASAQVHELGDIRQHGGFVDDSHPPVVDSRNWAMPAAVAAPVTGFNVADLPVIGTDLKMGVPV